MYLFIFLQTVLIFEVKLPDLAATSFPVSLFLLSPGARKRDRKKRDPGNKVDLAVIHVHVCPITRR